LPSDPGFAYPPDAGDSALGAWGLQNTTVLWAIATGQGDALALTPGSFQENRGRTPSCPDPECRRPMRRRPPTEDKPLRWVCQHTKFGMGEDGHWGIVGRFTIERPVALVERAPDYQVLDKLDKQLEERRDPATGKRLLVATPLERGVRDG